MSGWYFLFGFLGCLIGFIYGLIKGKEGDKMSVALGYSIGGCVIGLFALYLMDKDGIAKKIGIRDVDVEIEERNKVYEKNMDDIMSLSKKVEQQKESNFGISSAEKWLWNKISKANEYEVEENWPGTDSKIKKTYNHIKTLNVNYSGESDLSMERFRFIASGVTDEDESFHYEFIIEKINGHYGIYSTDAPKRFYK